MRQGNDLFEPPVLLVVPFEVLKILFATNAKAAAPVHRKAELFFYAFNDKWLYCFQEFLVIIVINVLTTLYKTQRANRANNDRPFIHIHYRN